jgi:PRC-barrel domain
MVEVENLADWRGKDLVDRDGDKIGELEDVYVDTETEQPMFGSVKEGLIAKAPDVRPAGRGHGFTRRAQGERVQRAGQGRAQHRSGRRAR